MKYLRLRTKCLNCYYLHTMNSILNKTGYLCSYDFTARTKKEMKKIKNANIIRRIRIVMKYIRTKDGRIIDKNRIICYAFREDYISYYKIDFFTMEHRDSLEDALTTKKRISEEVFNKLVDSGIYQFYCFDERINCDRYIICNIPDNLGLPVWLLKEEIL